MATVTVFPPNEASMAANATVPTRFTPGVVIATDGPERLGPEHAGALTLLHTTFVDDENAQRGYKAFGAIKPAFAGLPGFIRWLTFTDGDDTYTLGLWRNADDVMAFVRSKVHVEAAREQRENPFEYSQFSGVWTAHSVGARLIYCERCQSPTPAPATACNSCGNPLDDTFQRAPAT